MRLSLFSREVLFAAFLVGSGSVSPGAPGDPGGWGLSGAPRCVDMKSWSRK